MIVTENHVMAHSGASTPENASEEQKRIQRQLMGIKVFLNGLVEKGCDISSVFDPLPGQPPTDDFREPPSKKEKKDSRRKNKETIRQPSGSDMDTDNELSTRMNLGENQFAILAKWADEQEASTSTKREANNMEQPAKDAPVRDSTRKQRKPPPIIIQRMPTNVKETLKSVKEDCEGNLNTKYLGGKLKLQFEKTQDYIKFRTSAAKTSLEFHTYPLEEEKLTSLVLKGLPPMEEEDVKELVATTGLTPLRISRLAKAGESPVRPTFRITLPGTTTLRDARKHHNLDGWTVYWEKFNPKNDVVQCYRCQEFDHTSRFCNEKAKCVKCGENHRTADCPFKGQRMENPKCANCGGAHTASNKECPVYLQLINKRPQKKTRTITRPAFIEENKSFAAAMKEHTQEKPEEARQFPLLPKQRRAAKKAAAQVTNAQEEPNNETNDFQNLMDELRELNTHCNLTKMIKAVRTLNQRLRTCKDGFAKLQAFSDCAALLDD